MERIISNRCTIVTPALLLTNLGHIDHILLLLHPEDLPSSHTAIVDGALIKLEDWFVQLIKLILVLNALVKGMVDVDDAAALL